MFLLLIDVFFLFDEELQNGFLCTLTLRVIYIITPRLASFIEQHVNSHKI
jgi:hypothetical protein